MQIDGKKRALRIAMLGHKHIPSREGGVEIVVEELAVRMAALGLKLTCYNRGGHHTSRESVAVERISEYKGVMLKSVFTIDKKGLAAMTASFFAAMQAAFGKYDVVHFHAEGPCAMIWLPKLFGKRCIATIHGLDHRRAKWGKLASAYIMLGEKCAVRFADEIIVLSNGLQEYFRKTYNRETKYIPNGVNPSKQRPAKMIYSQFGLKKDAYILFLGRLVPEKGLRYLVEAFRELKTDKKLVIAGGTSDTDVFVSELTKMSEGDQRILFTGFVQGQTLEELYSNAYVYVLPSDLEGMPLSLLEAMSYGNCCLVSDIAECAEVVEDKAVVFEKSNVRALKEKLQWLLENEAEVRRYKASATDFICSKYNWDVVVSKTIALYNKNEFL